MQAKYQDALLRRLQQNLYQKPSRNCHAPLRRSHLRAIQELLTPPVQPGFIKNELSKIAHDLKFIMFITRSGPFKVSGYDYSGFVSVFFSHKEIAFNDEAAQTFSLNSTIFSV